MSRDPNAGPTPPDIYDVISAVGNHEVKSLVFASMQPGIPYTMYPLYHEFMALQGDNPSWDVHKYTPQSYCKTFAGAGLVAEDTMEINARLAYRVSLLGSTLARPLVGHLLALSLAEEPPLLGYFGPTHASKDRGKRPSESRIKIMRHLLEVDGKPSSMADVSDALAIPISQAGEIAEDMTAYDILHHRSTGYGKPGVRFTATPGFNTVNVRQDIGTPLLFDVLDVLKIYYRDNPGASISNSEIAHSLQAAGKYAGETIHALTKRVSNKTHSFVRLRNVLTATHESGQEKVRETISARDEQLERIQKVVDIIDGLQQPTEEYLADGARKLTRITTRPELVNLLVRKGKEHSIGRKGSETNLQEVRSAITTILADSPNAQTIRQVRDQLLAEGRVFDRVAVSSHLRTLTELGSVAVTETTYGLKYSIAGSAGE